MSVALSFPLYFLHFLCSFFLLVFLSIWLVSSIGRASCGLLYWSCQSSRCTTTTWAPLLVVPVAGSYRTPLYHLGSSIGRASCDENFAPFASVVERPTAVPIFVGVQRIQRNRDPKGKSLVEAQRRRVLVERFDDWHVSVLNKKLAGLNIPEWKKSYGFLTNTSHREKNHLVLPGNFWWQPPRELAAGRIVGLALVELPGKWHVGPTCLRTVEHRFYNSLCRLDMQPAMFEILDCVCYNSFIGVSDVSPGDPCFIPVQTNEKGCRA